MKLSCFCNKGFIFDLRTRGTQDFQKSAKKQQIQKKKKCYVKLCIYLQCLLMTGKRALQKCMIFYWSVKHALFLPKRFAKWKKNKKSVFAISK